MRLRAIRLVTLSAVAALVALTWLGGASHADDDPGEQILGIVLIDDEPATEGRVGVFAQAPTSASVAGVGFDEPIGSDGTFAFDVDDLIEADPDGEAESWRIAARMPSFVEAEDGTAVWRRSAPVEFTIDEDDQPQGLDDPLEIPLAPTNATLEIDGVDASAADFSLQIEPLGTDDPTGSLLRQSISWSDATTLDLTLPADETFWLAVEGSAWSDPTGDGASRRLTLGATGVEVTVDDDGVASPASAQVTLEDDPTIDGLVLDADGEPLIDAEHGVSVGLRSTFDGPLPSGFFLGLPPDDEGRFVGAAPDGSYVLSAGRQRPDGEGWQDVERAVTVDDGQASPADHDVVFLDEPTVQGTVLDPKGDPVDDVEMTLWRQGDLGPDPISFGWTRTDEDGRFTFAALDGRYWLDAWAGDRGRVEGLSVRVADGEVAEVDGQPVAEGDDVEVSFVPYNVEGAVVDVDGNPLADGWLRVDAADGDFVTDTFIAADGEFRLALEDGSYTLRVEPPDFGAGVGEEVELEVDRGQVTVVDGPEFDEDGRLVLQLVEPTVLGVLTSEDGGALEDPDEFTRVSIEVVDEQGGFVGSVRPDGDGRFAFLLDDGDYDLVLGPFAGFPYADVEPIPFTVTDGVADPDDLDVALSPATVVGTVSDLDATADDVLRVRAYADGEIADEPVAEGFTRFDDGRYALTLADGQYTLRAEAFDPLWGASEPEDIEVQDGEPLSEPVDFEVAERNVVVEVTRDGEPAGDTLVEVLDGDDETLTVTARFTDGFGSDPGSARFLLPEGDYTIRVDGEDGEERPIEVGEDGLPDPASPLAFELGAAPFNLEVAVDPEEGVAPFESELTVWVTDTAAYPVDLAITSDSDELTIDPQSGTIEEDDGPFSTTLKVGEDLVAPATVPVTVTATADDGEAVHASVELIILERPRDPTNLELTADLDEDERLVSGQPVEVTATVTSGDAPVPGYVEFTYAARGNGSGSEVRELDDDGTVAVAIDDLAVGEQQITARYLDSDEYEPSEQTLTVNVDPAETTTTLAPVSMEDDDEDGSVALAGETVAFEAFVTVDEPGGGSPSGDVRLLVDDLDGDELDRAALNGDGAVTLATDELEVGETDVVAVYDGDGSYEGSTSSPPVTVTVLAPSTATLTLDPATDAIFGQTIEATVEVTVDDDAIAPTGTVSFEWDGNSELADLDEEGVASLSIERPDLGELAITARYEGAAFVAPSEDEASIDVVEAPTQVDLIATPEISVTGEEVTLAATVSTPVEEAVAEGGVVFVDVTDGDDEVELGSSGFNAQGVASISVDDLPVGQVNVEARYSGAEVGYAPSEASRELTIGRASTRTLLEAESSTVEVGEGLTFDVDVEVQEPGGGTPGGSVDLLIEGDEDADPPIASGELDAASLSVTVDDLPVGEHALVAVYQGDAGYEGSTSTPVTVTVQAQTVTSLVLDPDTDDVPFGQTVEASATVTTSGDAPDPDGEVVFTWGEDDERTVDLDGQTATVDLDGLPVGEVEVTATFRGAPLFLDSDDLASVEVVAAPTTLEVHGTPDEPVSGQPVDLAVTVTAVHTDVQEGEVTVLADGDELGREVVSSQGGASVTLEDLPVGTTELDVVYEGTERFAEATATAGVEVVRAATETMLDADPRVVDGGEAIELDVDVDVVDPGAGVPTGEVTIDADGGDLAIEPLTLAEGTAAVTLDDLDPGSYDLTATYDGDERFEGSVSEVVALSVRAASTLDLEIVPEAVVFGQVAEARVTVSSDLDAVAEGTVQLTASDADGDGETILIGDEVALEDGGATIEVDGLAPGHWDLEASFSKTDTLQASEASATLEVVEPDPPEPTLEASTSGGLAPLEVTFDVDVADTGADVGWELDVGDGSDAILGDVVPEQVTHTFEEAGRFTVRLSAEDEFGNAASTLVRVDVALPEPPVAWAGSDRIVNAGEAVTFDASASSPSPDVADYAWDFGDGDATAAEPVAEHVFDDPGDYTVALTVTSGGDTDTDTVAVEVLDPTPEGLVVTVRGEGAPLADAPVVVEEPDGSQRVARTDNDGEAVLRGLAQGEVVVYTGSDGFLPEVAEAAVDADGRGEVTIDLEEGETLEGEVTAERLDDEQIADYGIDPNDPENQNIFEVEVNLRVRGSPVVGSFVFRGLGSGGGEGGEWITGSPAVGGQPMTCEGDRCGGESGGYRHGMGFGGGSGGGGGSYPQLTYIVIPIEGRFLKEFFDIEFSVLNLAPSAFTAKDMVAELPLPEGLSLAPIAGRQSARVAMGDIPGGQSETVNWIVRGDRSGHYDLEARASGVLDPIGETVDVVGVADEPLRVWGADALELLVEADRRVWTRNPMGLRLGFRNVADIDVYNTQITLLEGTENAIYQPRQPRVARLGTVPAGEEVWAPSATLVPAVTGDIVTDDSYVSEVAGEEIPDAEITTVEPMRPPSATAGIEAFPRREHVVLRWDAVDGAEAYEVFRTEDLETQFPDDPVEGEALGERFIAVPADADVDDAEWAVSTTIDGEPQLHHPVVRQGAADPPRYPAAAVTFTDGQAAMCGEPATLEVTFFDEVLELTEYQLEVDGVPILLPDRELDSGREATVPIGTWDPDDVDEDGVEVAVRARDQLGSWGPWSRTTLRPDCPGEPVVVLAAGLLSRLDGDDESWPELFGWPGDARVQSTVGLLEEELGFDLGHDGLGPYDEAPRNIIEYSYQGAQVRVEDGHPVFDPADYRARDTVYELSRIGGEGGGPSGWTRGTAEDFLDALVAYDEAWHEAYGNWIEYHFVGHSLGARQSLNVATLARERAEACEGDDDGYPCRRYEEIVGSVVSVSGAVYPLSVVSTISPASCALSSGLARAGDIAIDAKFGTWRIRVGFETGSALVQRPAVNDSLIDIAAGGTPIRTLGTPQDSCLSPRATLADDVHPLVQSSSHTVSSYGNEAHSALLKGGDETASGDFVHVRRVLEAEVPAAGRLRSSSLTAQSATATQDDGATVAADDPDDLEGHEVVVEVRDGDGAPAIDAQVVLARADAEGPLEDDGPLRFVDAGGQATFEGMLADSYEIIAGGPGWSTTRQAVEVTDGSVQATLTVEPAAYAAVQVVDDDPDGFEGGVPFLLVERLDGDGGTAEASVTDLAGYAVFTDLDEGSYDLRITDPVGLTNLDEISATVEASQGDLEDVAAVVSRDDDAGSDDPEPDPGVPGPGPGPAPDEPDEEEEPAPDEDGLPRAEVERLAGDTRYETAAEVALARFDAGTDVVYVGTGEGFADTLAGGPAAAHEGAAMLLTRPDRLPAATAGALETLDPDRVVLLGGASAVSDAVAEELEAYGQVQRRAGLDRFETAAVVAREAFDTPTDRAYVATGRGFADALSGGSVAAALGAPLLLTEPDALPEATAAALEALGVTDVTVLGGEAAVSAGVVDAIDALVEGTVDRRQGEDRFATAVEVAGDLEPAGTVYLATGRDFPDALAAVPVAAAEPAPILLVEPDGDLPPVVATALERFAPDMLVVLGGPRAVAEEVVEDAMDAVAE